MKKVKILEALQIVNDSVNFYTGLRPFLSTGDLNLDVISNLEYLSFNEKPSRANLNVKAGDIIVARMQGTVKVKIISDDETEVIVSTGFLVLRPKQNIDSDYLKHILLSESFQNDKNALCTGATQKAINNANFAKIEIPLPSLDQQKAIAAKLDKADEIRRLNQQLIDKYDALTQSLFIDMFGDPVKNEKGWEKVELRKLAIRFSDGPFGSNLKSDHYSEKGVQVIRLQNIGIGKFDNSDVVYIKKDHFDNVLYKYSCYSGDVLIATMGNPNIRACILPSTIELAVNKADCVLFRADTRIVNNQYINNLLNLAAFISLGESFFHGQTRSRISSGQLGKIQIPLPPIELQNQFAERIAAIEAQKQLAQDALAKSEALFNSLLQKSFS